MLKFLSIQNFTLIDRLEVEFQEGLNLITGETGSGKSILVGAVGLLLGSRASQEMVREGFESARVQGLFVLDAHHPARHLLTQKGVPVEGNELIVAREITRSGTNKVFINHHLVTQGFLQEMGSRLADIHGQHDQQLLLQPSVHLQFLDAFGARDGLMGKVGEVYGRLRRIRTRLEQRQAGEQDRLRRLDTLEFQIQDIEKLQLTPGLDQQLKTERELLQTAEQRHRWAREAYHLLYEGEQPLLAAWEQIQENLRQLTALDSRLERASGQWTDLRYQVEETAYQLRDYAEDIATNPERLEAVEERLAEIQKASRKYGQTVDDILAYEVRLREEWEELSQDEDSVGELMGQERELTQQYLDVAQKLSDCRRKDAQRLSRQVEQELAQLGMSSAVFSIHLTAHPEGPAERGIDDSEFLFSANPGESPKALSKVASGGELSRVILALKSILTLESYSKTLVFDEIDADIGGGIAHSLGEKLMGLADHHQVFCVTHLPQIAAFARRHFQVWKEGRGQRTVVRLQALDESARVEELARMMAGEDVSQTTRQHARELLERGAQRV